MTRKRVLIALALVLAAAWLAMTAYFVVDRAHLQTRASAFSQQCHRVANALRVLQLEIRRPPSRDLALRMLGESPGATYDEIGLCMLDETDKPYAALVDCRTRRDLSCLDHELEALESSIREVSDRGAPR